jgi:hypothetical protein
MAAQMTKSQLIERIAAENEVAKKDVKGVLETLAAADRLTRSTGLSANGLAGNHLARFGRLARASALLLMYR